MRKFLSQNGKQQAEINFPGINQAFPYIYNNFSVWHEKLGNVASTTEWI